jgi:hypothetical protein
VRAVLLPAGSDPFVLAYWLRNFATWSKYVDRLDIAVCGALEPEPLAFIKATVKKYPKAHATYIPHRTDHGETITRLFEKSKADTILLMEDDAFIRTPEVIDEYFKFAEAGGIVATTRGGYAASEVINVATEKFGDPNSFWPCFVFVSRDALEATDHHFSGKVWEPNSYIFDHQMREAAGADTFVWASYQLRAQGLTEKLIDNHRLSGQWVPEDAPWFHVGSLSSGHGLMLLGEIDEVRWRFEIDGFQRLPPGNAAQRLAWWMRVEQFAGDGIPEYRQRYREAIERVRYFVGVPEKDVEASRQFDDRWITWNERP